MPTMPYWRLIQDLKQFIYLVEVLQTGSLGLPDLGISTLDDVLIDVNRITNITDTPLLVDIDTGFGGALNISSHH